VTITDGYLTAQEASAYIGRQYPDGSGILDDVVSAVSRMIDQHCGRHFYQDGTVGTPVARVFEVEDVAELELGPFNDLVSISTLKTDDNGDGTYETTWSASNYQLCPVNAASRGAYSEPYTEIDLLNGTSFPSAVASGREYLIQVTGVWGWPAVPVEVKQAARILIAEVAKLQDAPLGVAGASEFGVFRVPSQMPPVARRMLGPLVHPAHVGLG
jgi:hypothetical protein